MTKSFRRRLQSIFLWSLVILAVFLAIIIGIAFIDPALIGKIAGDKGSKALGRNLSVDSVHVGWDWNEPEVHLRGVRLANLPNAPEPNMADIGEIDMRIGIWRLLEGQLYIPEIKLVNPKIALEKLDADTKNWEFPTVSGARTATHTVLPTKATNFPIIGKLDITNGVLIYRDRTSGLDTTLELGTANGSSSSDLKLTGQGKLHGQEFTLNAGGGSLDMLRASKQDYPLNVDIRMGKTHIKMDGVFHDIVKMEGINAQVLATGDNLADIFYVTGIPLPPSPPYSIAGHLQEHDEMWVFDEIKGKLGESDLEGGVSYDTSGKRAYMKGAVVSHLLRMEDLGGFIGANKPSTPLPSNEKRLLPDMPLDLARLRAADVDVDFNATRINQPGWPITDMKIHFHLKDGVLRIDPLSFGVADGKVEGPLVLDGSKDVPEMTTDISLKRLSLKPFFTDSRFAAFSTGHFGGEFKIDGYGKSLAEVLSDSNGRIVVMMSGGTVSKLIMDAAGLDFGKAIPALLGNDESTNIRCAIGDFGVHGGLLKSDLFVVDTEASNIDGDAAIDLKDESIHASIEAHPKEASITARTPITISGKLRSPSVGLDPKEIGARGAAAGVLSIFLTPLAAVIPFIEPGLGEDSDCRKLIDEAKAHAKETLPGK